MNHKNAIITGSSRGIGRATALLFARNGYNLLINCCHSHEELMKTCEEIRSEYAVKCIPFLGNAGDSACASELFSLAKKELGDIHLLINNAGVSHIGLLQDMTDEEWNRLLNTNLTSVFNMCRLVIPDMLSRKQGKIINISSVWGICGASCEAAYSATKGAVNALTRALGKELAPSGIQVNAIAFGAIHTSMNNCFSQNELDQLASEIPAGRMAEPEEAAEFILQLANSPSYLTGEVIKMDGGWI